jgi:hypothetical protein
VPTAQQTINQLQRAINIIKPAANINRVIFNNDSNMNPAIIFVLIAIVGGIAVAFKLGMFFLNYIIPK